MNAIELLPLIDPKLSPKYSPNLHKWVIGQCHKAWVLPVSVYRNEHGVLWIGNLINGELIGAKLNRVLCIGNIESSSCWEGMRGLIEVPDFWPSYIRDGRCAIDPEHKEIFVGDTSRWRDLEGGKARECLWCGHHVQVKLEWTETVHKYEWVTA